MSEKVILAVYDISQGMAKSLSPMILGQQIDAIYHSSLIVFGREYYFGQGICNDMPEQTPFGKPIEKIEMGNTQLPKEILQDYLGEISHKYVPEKYNLIENNCNNFTNEVCQFLIGKGIPSRIIDQVKNLLNTPAGQAFKPFLMQMQGAAMNQQQGQHN